MNESENELMDHFLQGRKERAMRKSMSQRMSQWIIFSEGERESSEKMNESESESMNH